MVLHNNCAEDRFAQEFGITVCTDIVSVPSSVLPPPLLKYHNSGREKICAPSVGQWNMINKKMINGGTVDNWTCLNFSRMRPEEVQRFCIDLIHMCNAIGTAVNPFPFVEIKSAAPTDIENALRDVHMRAAQMLAKQGMGNQLQLLIVILPDVSGSYGKIRRVCETDIGIVPQCCLPKHASRPNKQYLESLALKINVKVGGRSTVLEQAFVRNGIPFVSEVPTIITGADVTHIPPGEASASSIPDLKHHDSGREKIRVPSVGQWNMINKKMINGGTLDNCTCLNFSRMRPEEVQRFCMYLIHMCNSTGMAINPNPFIEVKSAAPNHIENALRYVHRKAEQMLTKQGTGNQLQLLLVILPDVTGSYGKIRRVCETDIGTVTQCCLPKHAKRPNRQFLENVALEIKFKVVRCNTVLERAFIPNGMPFVSEGPADITRTPLRENSASPNTAVVASMDWPEFTKETGLVYAQPHLQELIEDLFTVSKDQQKGHNVNCCRNTPQSLVSVRDVLQYNEPNQVLLHVRDIITKKKNVCKMIEVDVIILCLDGSVSLPVQKNSDLENIIYSAMKERNLYLSDWYAICDGKMLEKHSKIMHSCRILVHSRLRGGSGRGASGRGASCSADADDIKLREHVRILRRKKRYRWFERVSIPVSLRKAGDNVTSVVFLGPDARLVLKLLSNCLERAHRNQQCFHGNFSIEDIWYLKEYEVIEIRARTSSLIQRGYVADLQRLVDIINILFRYPQNDGTWKYPMYVLDLVTQISKNINEPGFCFFEKNRSLIFNNPATMSSAQRIKVFLLLVLYSDSLKGADKTAFFRALKNRQDFQWHCDVSGPQAPRAMKNVFFHQIWDRTASAMRNKTYPETVAGRIDFSRCLITHALGINVSAKQIDAAMFLMWNTQLPDVQRMLLLSYYPPSVEVENPDTFLPDTVPETIPENSCIEIYEIFGLPTPPKN